MRKVSAKYKYLTIEAMLSSVLRASMALSIVRVPSEGVVTGEVLGVDLWESLEGEDLASVGVVSDSATGATASAPSSFFSSTEVAAGELSSLNNKQGWSHCCLTTSINLIYAIF